METEVLTSLEEGLIVTAVSPCACLAQMLPPHILQSVHKWHRLSLSPDF